MANHRLVANPADRDLAKRIVGGDEAALDEFCVEYIDRLYRFATGRLESIEAIEDVVQETLIRGMRSMHGYRGEAALFSWLCQICRNQISDWYRKNHTAQINVPNIELDDRVRSVLDSQGELAGPARETERFATAEAVQVTLDYLPERYASALEWKYIEGLSIAEIADRLHVTRVAVQSLLARARREFRQRFTDLSFDLDDLLT